MLEAGRKKSKEIQRSLFALKIKQGKRSISKFLLACLLMFIHVLMQWPQGNLYIRLHVIGTCRSFDYMLLGPVDQDHLLLTIICI